MREIIYACQAQCLEMFNILNIRAWMNFVGLGNTYHQMSYNDPFS